MFETEISIRFWIRDAGDVCGEEWPVLVGRKVEVVEGKRFEYRT